MLALGPAAALAASARLLRARPLATLALGAALLTSLLSVVCGVGALAAAWFLCELFALQIGIGTGARPVRTRSWLWAGMIQVLAMLVMSSVAGLTMLAMGPDVLIGGARSQLGALEQLGLSAALLALAGGLALSLTVHFEHAPALLLDRGGRLSWALLESARLVSESGFFRTWLTSGAAHGLQIAPAVLGLTLASTQGSLASVPLLALYFVPLCAAGLALGQGMVVSSYLALRPCVAAPFGTEGSGQPSRTLLVSWSLLMAMALAGPFFVSAALLRPSRPAAVSLAEDAQVLLALVPKERKTEQYLPYSALSVHVSATAVRIVASDGGGAGKIPLPKGKVTQVRVARVPWPVTAREHVPAVIRAHAVEVTLNSGRRFTTFVDEAGVRLDDSAVRRLSALLPAWAVVALGLCQLWTALWMARALPNRKASSGLWLLPASVLSLGVGLWAAFA